MIFLFSKIVFKMFEQMGTQEHAKMLLYLSEDYAREVTGRPTDESYVMKIEFIKIIEIMPNACCCWLYDKETF